MSARASALAAVVLLSSACSSRTEMDVSIDLPPSITTDTTWLDIGVFRGASCDQFGANAASIPQRATASSVIRKNDGSKTTFGPFDKTEFTVVASAKDDTCHVVGTACTTVDLSDDSNVTLSFTALDEPVDTCGANGSCNHGRCVASPKETTVGQACSLVLVGQGSLGTPYGIDRTRLSAPSIARTDTGFMVGYREFDGSIGTARLSLVAFDTNGAFASASRSVLPERCAASIENDPVGLSWSGKRGLVAVARKSCASSPGGLDLFQVNSSAAVQSFVFNPTPDTSLDIALSNSHSVSASSGGAWITFLEGDTARVASSSLEGSLGAGATVSSSASGTWIAGSSSVGAFLVVDRPDTARLFIGPRAAAPETWTQVLTTSAPWGNLAVSGSDVVTLLKTSTGVSLSMFAETTSAGTFSLVTKSTALGADVAVADDAAFVVVEERGALSLSAVTSFSAPKLRETFAFKNEPRISVSANLKDGQVAVAASRDRVAVTWTTANDINLDEAVGGYAVFACETR